MLVALSLYSKFGKNPFYQKIKKIDNKKKKKDQKEGVKKNP